MLDMPEFYDHVEEEMEAEMIYLAKLMLRNTKELDDKFGEIMDENFWELND